jgi:AcrR family transcriptional regulator
MALKVGNAISDDDKRRRRRDLIETARRLFRERREVPPVADIAAATGLAKGTVYRYFETKDEIFVALIEDDFHALFLALDAMLESLPAEPETAAPAFACAYAATLGSLDTLLPLASLANGVFERNLRIEAMRGFKSALAEGLVAAGRKLEARFASLAEGGGATLLLDTYALTLGLWQALDYPKPLRAILDEPALRPLDRSFENEIETAVATLWRGALKPR